MYYQRDTILTDLFVDVVRYTENGPVWVHMNDKNSSWGRAFQYRDAARLGWALLDAASANGQPYPVKEGE